MSSGSPRPRNPAGHSGLLDNALGLISAVVEFFESRFVLLAQESKSAAVQLLILVGCVIVALALCLMGYVFLIVSAVARDVLASDSAGRCPSALRYRRCAIAGGAQPDHQADVSG